MIKGESSKKEKDHIVCYECKKLGHIKFECLLLKKQHSRKPNKKAMVATWSDSDASDNEFYDDEVANLCLMAFDDFKITSTSCDSNTYSFNELQDAFDELAIDFENMNVKYKKIIAKLTKAKIKLEKSIDSMKSELDDLTKKNVKIGRASCRERV